MLGVIIIHVLRLVPDSDNNYYIYAMIDSAFRFAVPCFIGVLGYMTYIKYTEINNWMVFFKNKLLYLTFPFLIWSVLYVYSPRSFPYYQEQPSLLKGVIYGDAEIHLYYMVAYFLFLLITPVVVFASRRFNRHLLTVMLFAGVIGHIIVLINAEMMVREGMTDNIYFQLQFKTPIHWLSFYATGILVAIHKERLRRVFLSGKRFFTYTFPLLLIFYLILILNYVANLRHLYTYYNPALYLIFVVSLLLLLIIYAYLKDSKFVRLIAFIGINSFPIYLSHVMWIKLGSTLFKEIDVTALILVFIISILLSLVYIKLHSVFKKFTRLNLHSFGK